MCISTMYISCTADGDLAICTISSLIFQYDASFDAFHDLSSVG